MMPRTEVHAKAQASHKNATVLSHVKRLVAMIDTKGTTTT